MGAIARIGRTLRLKRKFRRWQKNGAVGPMPNLGKQQVVIDYIKRFRPEVFIETGTYKGKMVYAVMPCVKEIYSIELDQRHFENARQRFAGYPNIHMLQGSSEQVLPGILANISKYCLFWLDAHYSGGSTAKGKVETPIMQEVKCILKHPMSEQHVILIDDAQCFTGKNDYPSIEQLKQLFLNRGDNWRFEMKDDIIRVHSADGKGNG